MGTTGLATLSSAVIDQGLVHHIDLKHCERVFAAPGEWSQEDLVPLLLCGNAIVSRHFTDHLDRTEEHEVYRDKVIDEARSAHGVGFGRLVGSRPDLPGGRGKVLEVAMKPFGTDSVETAEGAATDAINEVLGYWILKGAGTETFEPVGIFPSTAQTAGSAKEPNVFVVVTQKHNTLQSLDRDDWLHGFQIESEDDVIIAERNTTTVREIFDLKAWLEGNGIFHVDGQTKNWAVTTHGKVGVIDTENLTVLPIGHEHSADLSIDVTEKMLKSLMSNDKDAKIYGVGLLDRMSSEDLQSRYQDLMLDPYCEALVRLASQGKIDSKQAEVLLAGAFEHFERAKREGWPSHLLYRGHGKSK